MTVRGDSAGLANLDAEWAILSCLIHDNKRIDRCADMLREDDFSHPLYGRMYAAIVREYSLGRAPGVITLLPYFEEDADFKDAGGRDFLIELGESETGLMNPRGFIEQVRDLASRRRLIAGLDQTVARAADPEATVEQLIEAADAAIFDATSHEDSVVQISAGNAAEQLLGEMGKPDTGARSGIEPIDRLIGLARPKQLIVLAGRPGSGKTATAVSYALGCAINGHAVLFNSLEMSAQELSARMLADLSERFSRPEEWVPFDVINERRASSAQMRELARLTTKLKELPIEIVDAGSLTAGRIAMLTRRYKRRFAAKGLKLALVVVDYLQLVKADRPTKGIYETVSEVSRALKGIAKDMDVPVMALAQLSRAVEQREDKRPVLSDLRDSGQIEQDADMVLFLYREAYYLQLSEPSEEAAEHAEWAEKFAMVRTQIDFIMAKKRNGRTGRSMGNFYGEQQAVRA